MTITRYEISQGDGGKTITASLFDVDLEPVDLSDVTSLTFSAGRTGFLVIDGEDATPDDDQDANKGVATFELTAEHSAIVGDFPAQFRAEWADGTVHRFPTEPLTLSVTRSVAVPAAS